MNRLDDPRMDYYKEVFKNSPTWNSEDLSGKRVIVYGEQGFGDIIQFARYIQPLKSLNCEVYFYVPVELHRLFKCLNVNLLDKSNPDLPEHDFHILSLDLPFKLGVTDVEIFPYLNVDESISLEKTDAKKIGIAWEGNPNHPSALQRHCPLKHFRMLQSPITQLYMLQKEIVNESLLIEGDDLEIYGYPINDFYDTAMLINEMDAVVCVDTSILHLSGALNKLTYALLAHERDSRWDVKNWYRSVVCIKQKAENNWTQALQAVVRLMTGTMYSNVSIDKEVKLD